MRLNEIEEALRGMQDYGSQLNDFLIWLDEIETPIETLFRDSSNQASLEDRDQVMMWANHHRVSLLNGDVIF